TARLCAAPEPRFVPPTPRPRGDHRRRQPRPRGSRAGVARTGAPGVPALIWLADLTSLRTPAGTLALDGTDVARPGAYALAPLGAPADPLSLDAWLAAQGARVTVAPAAGGSLRVPPPPIP